MKAPILRSITFILSCMLVWALLLSGSSSAAQIAVTFRDGSTQAFTLNQPVASVAKVEISEGGGAAKNERAGALAPGNIISLQSVNYPTHYLRHRNYIGQLTTISSALDRSDATFRTASGLAGGDSISFESVNYPGYFLRHQGFQIKLHQSSGDQLYRSDASFRARPGLADRSKVSFESVNYPGYYLRHRGFQFYIEQGSGDLYNKDCTFSVVDPLVR
jgi:hypothetical protein